MSFAVVQANLYRKISTSVRWISPTDPALPQILFLNKNDLFEQKIQTSDIKNFFPVRLTPTGCGAPLSPPSLG